MGTILWTAVGIVLLGGSMAESGQRPYHPATVATLATAHHTHIELSGTVTLVKMEQDGDRHIRISDDGGKTFIVAELVPTMTTLTPTPVPKVGECVTVRGIRRFDDESPGHHWWEVHPVEQLRIVPCK